MGSTSGSGEFTVSTRLDHLGQAAVITLTPDAVPVTVDLSVDDAIDLAVAVCGQAYRVQAGIAAGVDLGEVVDGDEVSR